jgi:hypothetical protein
VAVGSRQGRRSPRHRRTGHVMKTGVVRTLLVLSAQRKTPPWRRRTMKGSLPPAAPHRCARLWISRPVVRLNAAASGNAAAVVRPGAAATIADAYKRHCGRARSRPHLGGRPRSRGGHPLRLPTRGRLGRST